MDLTKETIDFAIDVLATSKTVDSEAALRAVHQKARSGRVRRIARMFRNAAAILCVPFAALSIWALSHRSEMDVPEPSIVEVRATEGMIAELTLPDSSRVWLNSGSVLRYPASFSQTRDVELIGEGYFKVSKDPLHKFNVKTSAMTIEVVGTEFNIDSYDIPGRSVKTTLVNGAINMHYTDVSDAPRTLKIYPGQCASMETESKQVSLYQTDVTAVSSWRFGKIHFNRTPALEALRMIENRYNVLFDVKNDSLYSHRFTGQFDGQRLDVVLEHFSRSAGMKFQRHHETGDNVNGREIIEVY